MEWIKGTECKWRCRNVDEVNEDAKLVDSLLKTGLEQPFLQFINCC